MKLFFLCALMVLLLCASPLAEAQRRHHRRSGRSSNPKVAELQNRLANLRQKKQNLKKRLKANHALTHQTLIEIQQVDAQLGVVQEDLENTELQLADSRVRQKQVTGELHVA